MPNKSWIVALCLAVTALVSCGVAEKGSSSLGLALPEWETNFTFDGKPIHPAIIHKFQGWLSDSGPIVAAVDVAAAQGTNEYSVSVSTYGDSIGFILLDTDPQESYAYRWIGRMADGTHVVAGTLITAGTGRFETLYFFRFSVDDGYAVPGDPVPQRVVLNVTGWHPLGDRAYPSLRIVGDHVDVIPRPSSEDPFAGNATARTHYPARQKPTVNH